MVVTARVPGQVGVIDQETLYATDSVDSGEGHAGEQGADHARRKRAVLGAISVGEIGRNAGCR